jgi:hypothetical protein
MKETKNIAGAQGSFFNFTYVHLLSFSRQNQIFFEWPLVVVMLHFAKLKKKLVNNPVSITLISQSLGKERIKYIGRKIGEVGASLAGYSISGWSASRCGRVREGCSCGGPLASAGGSPPCFLTCPPSITPDSLCFFWLNL